MISRILVPLDGSKLSEQVLPFVKSLSKATQAHILLFQVIVPPPPDVVAVLEEAALPRIEERFEEARLYLDQVADALRGEGLKASVKVTDGYPASDIVSVAEQEAGTLIAMSTHGRSGITRWALGSVTDKVLHATSNPLLIVRSSDEDAPALEVAIQNIIVPLDGSKLAEQILPYVEHLAKGLDVGVTLLRITPSAADYYRYMDDPIPQIDDLPEQVDAEALEYLREQGRLLCSKGVARVEERLSHGSPAIEVADFAAENPNSLVAMTTQGRSGLLRWIVGSVADRVVRHSGGPVLLVRSAE